MPMQYGGGNKVSGMPKIRSRAGAPMPGGTKGVGNAGTTKIGGANGVGAARVVGGAPAAMPGTRAKKKQPFNAARQKGLAVALRARSARGIPVPGSNGMRSGTNVG